MVQSTNNPVFGRRGSGQLPIALSAKTASWGGPPGQSGRDKQAIVFRPAALAIRLLFSGFLLLTVALRLAALGSRAHWPLPLDLVLLLLLSMVSFSLFAALWTRVVLQNDVLESYALFKTRRIKKSQISGFALVGSGAFQLLPVVQGDPVITLSAAMLKSPQCAHWFAGMPDMTADRKAQIQSDIDNCEALGVSPQARQARAKQLNILGLVMVVSAAATNYLLAAEGKAAILGVLVLLCLPIGCAVFLRVTRNTTLKASQFIVGCALFIPSVMANITGGGHLKIVGSLYPFAAVTAAVIGGLLLWAGGLQLWRRKAAATLAIVAIVLLFSNGVVTSIDVDLDTSRPEPVQTPLARMYASSGKPHFFVVLPGPNGGEDRLVSRSDYLAMQSGAPACIINRAGALNVPWNRIGLCG